VYDRRESANIPLRRSMLNPQSAAVRRQACRRPAIPAVDAQPWTARFADIASLAVRSPVCRVANVTSNRVLGRRDECYLNLACNLLTAHSPLRQPSPVNRPITPAMQLPALCNTAIMQSAHRIGLRGRSRVTRG
jgi:hypothetical protein